MYTTRLVVVGKIPAVAIGGIDNAWIPVHPVGGIVICRAAVISGSVRTQDVKKSAEDLRNMADKLQHEKLRSGRKFRLFYRSLAVIRGGAVFREILRLYLRPLRDGGSHRPYGAKYLWVSDVMPCRTEFLYRQIDEVIYDIKTGSYKGWHDCFGRVVDVIVGLIKRHYL